MEYEALKKRISEDETFKFFDSKTDEEFKGMCYNLAKGGSRKSWGCRSVSLINASGDEMFLGYVYDEDYDRYDRLLYKQFAVTLYTSFLGLDDEDCFHFFFDDSKPIEIVLMDFTKSFAEFTSEHDLDPQIMLRLVDDFLMFMIDWELENV